MQFGNQYSKFLSVLSDVNHLTNDFGRLLSENHEKAPFASTSLQFARIAVETPDAIVRLLEAGNIAQSYVLLRWYLEMANLCFFLWKNPEAFEEWSNGDQVRPRDARQFISDCGFQSLASSYSEWSHVVHGNAKYVSSSWTIAQRTPMSEGKYLVIGSALINLICLSQRFNYVLGQLLREEIGLDINKLAERYNELDNNILALSKEQQKAEDHLMQDSQ